jgi:uncharacterized protein YbbK (DUF523 family)
MLAGMQSRPRVGVSACLAGRKVRYDGDDKRDGGVCDLLAPVFELVEICPEVELGMGVPRDPVRLVSVHRTTRMIAPRTQRDYTDEMNAWAEARVRALEATGLSGYVLKKNSPSCGLRLVKLYDSAAPDAEPVALAGVGLFAAALRRRMPELPMVDEEELADPGVRARFIDAVTDRAGRR